MKTKIKVFSLIVCFVVVAALILFFANNKKSKNDSMPTSESDTTTQNLTPPPTPDVDTTQPPAPPTPDVDNSAILEDLKTMTHDELVYAFENITDGQLIEIYNNPKIPLSKNLHEFDTFGVEFLKAEKGEPTELWYESDVWLSGSVSSSEQAKEIASRFGKAQDAAGYTVEFIGENDLYYQFRVTIDYSLVDYAFRINFYKDSIFKFSKSVETYGGELHYRFSDVIFQKLDYETVLTVMDLVNSNSRMYGDYILYRYFEENDTEYSYVQYRTEVDVGDWGISDRVSLKKCVSKINKATGTISESSTYIKDEIAIPGTNKSPIIID